MLSVAVTRKFAKKIYSKKAESLRARNYVDLAAICKLHSFLDALLKRDNLVSDFFFSGFTCLWYPVIMHNFK